jgi:phosphatidylglycerol:prolipoprotein diacylglycerol transferase
MGLFLLGVHPIAFHYGPFVVRWFSIMLILAFSASIWTAYWRSQSEPMGPKAMSDMFPWIIFGTLCGAHVVYVIGYSTAVTKVDFVLQIIKVWQGGFVFYGGLFGGCLTVLIFSNLKRLRFWSIMDILAPSMVLGSAVGRVGCFLNGCCYGKPSSLPWAVCYPEGHETHPYGYSATAVHPTQIYEISLELGLYIALEMLYKHKRFNGQVFCTYLIAYSILRAFVEIFRGDYPVGTLLIGEITPGQVDSILALGLGMACLYSLRHVRDSNPQTKPAR